MYLRSTTIVTRLTEHGDVIISLLRGAPRLGLALAPALARAGPVGKDSNTQQLKTFSDRPLLTFAAKVFPNFDCFGFRSDELAVVFTPAVPISDVSELPAQRLAQIDLIPSKKQYVQFHMFLLPAVILTITWRICEYLACFYIMDASTKKTWRTMDSNRPIAPVLVALREVTVWVCFCWDKH